MSRAPTIDSVTWTVLRSEELEWASLCDRGKSPNTYEVYHTQNAPTGEVPEWSHGRPGTVLVAFLLSSDIVGDLVGSNDGSLDGSNVLDGSNDGGWDVLDAFESGRSIGLVCTGTLQV